MKTNLLKITLAVLCLAGLAFGTAAAAVVINTVAVADLGNGNDTRTGSLYGSVAYNYRIGTYDVTNAQYSEFLNAVDPSAQNALSLYNSGMRIYQNAGAASGSKYSVNASFINLPVQWVSISDAKRFANWLNNGQGSGNTETGAYTMSLGGLAPRNASAAVFIPSENEWYKAAYYDPTISGANKFHLYGTRSNTAPFASAPTDAPNRANYADVVGDVTAVGAYSGSASYYGAFDMSGNVLNYTEGVFSNGPIARGGWYHYTESGIASTQRNEIFPVDYEYLNTGFRVASFAPITPIPEPGTALIGVLLLGVVATRRRRAQA